MKKDKLKSVVLKFSIVFFIVIALLTYFSKTINNMLLPKVKVVSVDICNSDELYCEVTSDSLFGDSQVVYKTTKSIENGSSVYIEEETV